MDHESEAMEARRRDLEMSIVGLVMAESLLNRDESTQTALDEAYTTDEQYEALTRALMLTIRSSAKALGVEPLELTQKLRTALNELQ